MSESTAESLPPPNALEHVETHTDAGFWSSVGEALR